MKKILTNVLLLLSAVIILAGSTSNVAFAESGHQGHLKGKRVTVRHASCYQDGVCIQNGACDRNGICQNGGYCSRRVCHTSNHAGNYVSCTHSSDCVLHNGSCYEPPCTHSSDCALHNGSCYQGGGSGHHSGNGHHGSGSHHSSRK